MRHFIVLAIIATSTLASADAPKTVTGDPAKNLMRAFKLAGVKPTAAKNHWTWKAAEVFCHNIDETTEKLGGEECTFDKQKLVDAAALVVKDALIGAGVKDKFGMGGSRTNAYDLVCDDVQGGGEAFTCKFGVEPPGAK